MTTPAELKSAEAELAYITTEKLFFSLLMGLVREQPEGAEKMIQYYLSYVGTPEDELDRKTQAFLTLARAPRLAV